MKWYNYLGISTGIIINLNINNVLNNVDKKIFLSLFINSDVSFLDIYFVFINMFIKIFTGVNLYNLNESLRIYGII